MNLAVWSLACTIEFGDWDAQLSLLGAPLTQLDLARRDLAELNLRPCGAHIKLIVAETFLLRASKLFVIRAFELI